MRMRLVTAILFASALILAADAQDGPKDAVVLIIRHAEDGGIGRALATPRGEQRAEAYKDYFLQFTVDSKPRGPASFLPLKTQRRVIGRV